MVSLSFGTSYHKVEQFYWIKYVLLLVVDRKHVLSIQILKSEYIQAHISSDLIHAFSLHGYKKIFTTSRKVKLQYIAT